MGESSELGPIDPQIYIIQDNHPQQVSADHFLRAYKKSKRSLASSKPQEQQAAQIQLALISPAFLQQCSDLIGYSKTCAGEQLQSHMFATECAADQKTWEQRIKKIVVENLTASSRHLLHGRMITATDMKADPALSYLKVRILPRDDPYWNAMDDLLLRTDAVVRSNQVGKVVFARDFQMFSS